MNRFLKKHLVLTGIIIFSCFVYVYGQTSKKSKKYDIAAYVWPAYHNEPRYAEIGVFTEGVGEWEAIYQSKPKYDGHRQPRVPLWGYLDETDPKVQEKKIKTALKYGVNTFIFDWYWYDDRPFLEDVLNKGFLKARNNRKMNFYLMWANHTMPSYLDHKNPDKTKEYWQGAVSREVFDGFTDHLINSYFKQPNYYKIDGKPVFAIYEVSTFIAGMGGEQEAKDALDGFRQKCVAAGFPGVHIQAILWGRLPKTVQGMTGGTPTQDNTVKYLGFESLTNYQWCHYVSVDQDYQSYGEQGQAKYKEFGEFSVPYFPHVAVGWDPSPRYPDRTPAHVKGVTPAKFEGFLRVAKEYVDSRPNQSPLITINSWNEWSEGSYLEPDKEFGYGFLEAIKRVFK